MQPVTAVVAIVGVCECVREFVRTQRKTYVEELAEGKMIYVATT